MGNNNSQGVNSFPELLTEDELVQFLRLDVVSHAKNYHNVIENLKRAQDLPCIHISRKCLYPIDSVRTWIKEKTAQGTA